MDAGNQNAANQNEARLSASSVRAMSGGRITGGWVRAVKPPLAKGLSRGYDRKAVDALLLQCANGVDWLNGLLVGAENEIARLTQDPPAQPTARLTQDAPAQPTARLTGRSLVTSSHGKRSNQVKVASKRPRLRTARPGRVRP